MKEPDVQIRIALTPDDFKLAKNLILDYVQWLGMDLSFQNFDTEINDLKGMYFEPSGGLLLATVNGEGAGVAGIRKFQEDECELKRMFVQSDFRKLGIGKKLIGEAIELARRLKYKTIKLDTAGFMNDAIRLYKANGFVEIAPYRFSPETTAKYFELKLTNQ